MKPIKLGIRKPLRGVRIAFKIRYTPPFADIAKAMIAMPVRNDNFSVYVSNQN